MARRGRRRRRRSDRILAAALRGRWTEGPPDEGPGLAGVREPRRPKPAPSSLQAARPEPVGAPH